MSRQILLDAKHEIESLRRRNEILEAKVSTMELMATFLHTSPAYQERPMGVDVAWSIQQEIDRIDTEDEQGPR